ncbi:Leucine-rich repeat serine/threonine-protein kinase 2, partial [Coemansia helicoidea]
RPRAAAWTPYPDHSLTLWATEPRAKEPAPNHLDSDLAPRHKKRLQWWQVSRDFRDGGAEARRGRTVDVLATHRLNFSNQSICALVIPEWAVAHLGNLVELRIPQNKMRTLPPALFRLAGLEILNLEHNRLDEHCAPDRLWREFSRLRVLFLADNRFRQLPPSIGRMPRLFYLDASDNPRLESLPVEVLASASIATLTVQRCSPALAQRLAPDGAHAAAAAQARPLVPFADLVAGGPGATHTRTPPLAAMCARQIAKAAIPDADSTADAESRRQLRAACEELRRWPDEHHPLPALLRRAADAEPGLCLCSVCGLHVYYSSYSFVALVDGCELPAEWRCCSARCRDTALESGAPHVRNRGDTAAA